MANRTKSAHAWISWKRGDYSRRPTWFDVADAYDAGLRHGLSRPKSAIKRLEDAGAMISALVKRRTERTATKTTEPGDTEIADES